MRVIVFCLMTPLLFVGSAGIAHAGCVTYGQSYGKQVYVEKQEVLVASFFPLVVAVPTVAVGASPAVAPAVQAPAAATAPHRAQSEQIAALELKIERLEKLLAGQQPQPAQPQAQPPASLPLSAEPPKDVDAKAVAILKRDCAACHTGEAAKGNVRIFEAGGSLSAGLDRFAVWDAVDEGRMPKGKPAASDDDARALRTWLKSAKK